MNPARQADGELTAGTFFAGLDAVERESLLARGVKRAFPRGAVLMFQEDPDDRVMVILGGRVKVVRIDEHGHDLMLSIRDPGDVLGELAFIDGGPRVATVSALESTQALVMPAETFRRHLETTPRVAVVLLEIVARRFRAATEQRAQLGTLDTMGRLAARILELAERYGEPDSDGDTTVTLPISREDLATWTGASRAGLADALRRLRELGWVQTDGHRLIVRDTNALQDRAT
jgi:CRP/FNR family transcriptional regulator, cyclic AMP receptor protein